MDSQPKEVTNGGLTCPHCTGLIVLPETVRVIEPLPLPDPKRRTPCAPAAFHLGSVIGAAVNLLLLVLLAYYIVRTLGRVFSGGDDEVSSDGG